MSLLGWSFAAPMLLWGLVGLPILWLILRAIPPAPIRRHFPAVILMLGLKDDENSPDRTPWWLLALRAVAVACAIVGFAGPSRAPQALVQSGKPLLIVMDGSWAMAQDWPNMRKAALQALADAGRAGRRVAALQLTDAPQKVQWQGADAQAASLAAAAPAALAPSALEAWAQVLAGDDFDTFWLSDGLAYPGRAELLAALQRAGAVEVALPALPPYGMAPSVLDGGEIVATALRAPASNAADVIVVAIGTAPNGAEAELGRATASFAAGEDRATARLNLPPELRARITRFEIDGQRSAGAVSLTDDTLKRRKVAIVSPAANAEALQLLSPTHYLNVALSPSSDLVRGTLDEVLTLGPDTIIMADVGQILGSEDLEDWINRGGTLLRFAGPRLAAAQGDDFLPVPLRAGGRATGGAMSWDTSKTLAPFDSDGPFAGLVAGDDVTVSAQVLAQPSPELAGATLAALSDGTPLVTRRKQGAGQIVLFHITANAQWSTLPLSGLFVQMLERLAVASRQMRPARAEVQASLWQPQRITGPYGGARDGAGLAGVDGAALWAALQDGPSASVPAGLYAGETRSVALNIVKTGDQMRAFDWPIDAPLHRADTAPPLQGKGPLLAGAALMLMLDALAALALSGKLMRGAAVLGCALLLPSTHADAEDFAALRATRGVVLAHVRTGDAQLDQIAADGLRGLGEVLSYRTSIEPDLPVAVDIETDELDFYPFLYWPISPQQDLPSPAALAKINRFLRTGGMIMFDTRVGDLPNAPEAQALQALTLGLDIPPLEPVPPDHVLTRSFYLLDGFAGRYEGAPVWVEAATDLGNDIGLGADGGAPNGMPFRNLNDGVTPVIIGSNDWAGAWAVDDNLSYRLPVGRGFAGEQQREYAFRFGINVIMHVLTGNYKSDQVHVPALLDRLGQ